MTLRQQFRGRFPFAASFLFATGLLTTLSTPGYAQYTVTNLVSNQNAIGANPADPALVNAWGLIELPTSPFWVSDNGTGLSTLYNSTGQKQALVVTSMTRCTVHCIRHGAWRWLLPISASSAMRF